MKPGAIVSIKLEEHWCGDYILGLCIDGANYSQRPAGLKGKTAAEASDAAAQLSLDAFKQTAERVANVFGEAAAKALFTVDGGAAFVGGSLQSGTI